MCLVALTKNFIWGRGSGGQTFDWEDVAPSLPSPLRTAPDSTFYHVSQSVGYRAGKQELAGV